MIWTRRRRVPGSSRAIREETQQCAARQAYGYPGYDDQWRNNDVIGLLAPQSNCARRGARHETGCRADTNPRPRPSRGPRTAPRAVAEVGDDVAQIDGLWLLSCAIDRPMHGRRLR